MRQLALKKLGEGIAAYRMADTDRAFRMFEDAHILGQRFTLIHLQSHWWMLKTAYRSRRWSELVGQIPRLMASFLFTWLWVPKGNNGRAAVSAFRSMPIPDHLAEYFKHAER